MNIKTNILLILNLCISLSCVVRPERPGLITFNQVTYRGPLVMYFISYDSLNMEMSIEENNLDITSFNFKFIISKKEFDELSEFIINNRLDYCSIDKDSIFMSMPKILNINVFYTHTSCLRRSCIERDCKDYLERIMSILSKSPSKDALNLIKVLKERREFAF